MTRVSPEYECNCCGERADGVPSLTASCSLPPKHWRELVYGNVGLKADEVRAHLCEPCALTVLRLRLKKVRFSGANGRGLAVVPDDRPSGSIAGHLFATDRRVRREESS